MTICCKELHDTIQSDIYPMEYIERFREYYLNLSDRFELFDEQYFFGNVIQKIDYCPFCGEKFPLPLRDKWYIHIDQLGIDPSEEDLIPEEYKTDIWWKIRGY